jgi:hypothetical protein
MRVTGVHERPKAHDILSLIPTEVGAPAEMSVVPEKDRDPGIFIRFEGAEGMGKRLRRRPIHGTSSLWSAKDNRGHGTVFSLGTPVASSFLLDRIKHIQLYERASHR